VYETIHDIDDLRKRLMQTWFDFDLDVSDTIRLTSGIPVSDHVCGWWWTLWTHAQKWMFIHVIH